MSRENAYAERQLVLAELRRRGWSEDEAAYIVTHERGSLLYAQVRLNAHLRELGKAILSTFPRRIRDSIR